MAERIKTSGGGEIHHRWGDDPRVPPVHAASNGDGRPRGESPHMAAHAVVVVDRVMHYPAIVPDRQRAGLPVHAAGELRPCRMTDQPVDQRLALVSGHALKV